ncbi:Major facilitator superfamily domain general substrate transporter [Penicillium pulvis]|uniref:Major facilitator superfamily domain general substrate transporter n=1 Tax=Penicillium pulvis TaxID=1562058 RepID=UPI002547C912|nr:Major facilitator superfamily domain general substrate transporter [Penicillium pulvis]KAJ5809815.1 Major facilitator superfamily domain general substrate transporter [Penicillium pulvis]
MASSSTGTDQTINDHKTRNMVATESGAFEGYLGQQALTTASSSAEKHHTSHPAKDMEKGTLAGDDTCIADPNLVDWDGPDDPANPRNWPKTFKMANVMLVSLSVLYCNLATTMFSPGAKLMQSEFGFKSDTVEILTITIASLGFAMGQFFVPPLSEVFGRVPVYRVSSIFYLGFTAGCARSTHVAEFLVFRLCTGLSAASYMSTGGGTVADLLPKEERGAAMALFTAGPLLGPVLGPIVGGFVTENLSWRWTFYLILMLAGTISVASFVFMRETSAVTILQKKATQLRKETGNPNLHAKGEKQTPISHLISHAVTRPATFLVRSPVLFLTSLYIAFNFGLVMLLFATFPTVFETYYGWSVGVSGLAYVGVGIGCAVGVSIFANFSDRLLHAEGGKFHAERRLILMMWVSPLFPIGLFLYGWTVQYRVHWVVPIIGTAICGPGAVIINSSAQTYIIDIFGPETAASAIGALTIIRNMTGAFLPLAAPSLYAHLDMGWGNSVLAFITIAFIPIPFLFYWKGEWLRQKFPVKP